MTTFADILRANKEYAPGFNTIRVALALAVMLDHSVELSSDTGHLFVFSPSVVGARMFIVPAFFGLSGFLVTGSMIRLRNVLTFGTFRALRIFPALALEVVLSAVLLGGLLTNLPAKEYFTDPAFFAYFRNIVGNIHFTLPGVFIDPARTNSNWVNGSLWTVPSEMYCYISLGILMIIGIAYKKVGMLAFLVLATLFLVVLAEVRQMFYIGVAHWTTLILCFYAGAVLFLYRERVPSSGWLAVLGIVGFEIGVYSPFPVPIILGPISVTYVICFFGMQKLWRNPLYFPGDYSYGIYLYGFPIEQTVVWASRVTAAWWQVFLVATTITIGIAMFSWHVIEKPALDLRSSVSRARLARREQGVEPISRGAKA